MDMNTVSARREEYYRITRERIAEEGLLGKIEVDTNGIGMIGDMVKVYIKPLPVAGNRKVWKQAREMKEFYEIKFRPTEEEPERMLYKGYFALWERRE